MSTSATSAPATSLTLYTVGDLLTTPARAIPWLVEGLLTPGGRLLLYGPAGVGKSTIALQLAASLATGQPFLGLLGVDRPLRVLFLQAELSEFHLVSVGQLLERSHPGIGTTDRLQISGPPGIRLPRDVERVRKLVDDTKADVLILDPFYAFYGGDSIDEPAPVNAVFHSLNDLLQKGLQAVVVVHHSPKATAYNGREHQRLTPAGSWAFSAWPDAVVGLESKPPSQARSMVVVKQRMPLSPQGARYALEFGSDGYRAIPPGPRSADPSLIRQTAAEGHAAELERLLARNGQMSRTQLLRATHWDRDGLDGAIASLAKELESESQHTRGRPRTTYRLSAQLRDG